MLAYDPPHRVCFSWDINLSWQLETDPAKTSEVEVTFAPDGPERTQVVSPTATSTVTATAGRTCATRSAQAGTWPASPKSPVTADKCRRQPAWPPGACRQGQGCRSANPAVSGQESIADSSGTDAPAHVHLALIAERDRLPDRSRTIPAAMHADLAGGVAAHPVPDRRIMARAFMAGRMFFRRARLPRRARAATDAAGAGSGILLQ